MQAPEMEPELWPVVEAVLATQEPEKGQEGGATHGKARRCREHGGRVQRQDPQPGGNRTADNRPLPWCVLHHLQAPEAQPAWYWGHLSSSLIPLEQLWSIKSHFLKMGLTLRRPDSSSSELSALFLQCLGSLCQAGDSPCSPEGGSVDHEQGTVCKLT
ncbi:hypothetical protein LEMLEM_LOCUS12770 [Lemmus lemmus]